MRKLFASLAFVLFGCGLPTAPTLPTDDTRFQAAAVAPPTGLTDDPAMPLTLLPGDVISVQLISTDDSQYDGLLVDEQGNVHMPLVGPVPIGGLSIPDAERRMQQATQELDRVARVAIRITEPGGHMATVLGAVGSPGRVPVVPGMRLADLLAAVRGPAESVEPMGASTGPVSDLAAARLVRNGEPLPVSVPRAVEGDPLHNVRVRPGDHLYVPPGRSNLVIVLGAVSAPSVMSHREGLRLTEVLARAGGLNEQGDRTDIHIVRGPLDQPLVYQTSLRAIINGNANDVVLAAGDVVYVTEEWSAHVGEVLARLSSLLTTPATIAITAAVTR